MKTNLRTLGPNETKVVLSFHEQGRDVVQAKDVIDLLGSEQPARKVIRNLLRKGWFSRLIGGRYMLLPPNHGPDNIGENNPLALAAAAITPSYIGWWSAASFHGFTTQKPMTVSVAVLRTSTTHVIEDTEVNFFKTSEQKFFGFKEYEIYGRKVVISDPEKTVIDCIDHPEFSGGISELARIVYGAMGEIEQKKLVDMALKMNSVSLLQRLGFLTDLVKKPLSEKLRLKIRKEISKSSRSIFGRPARKEGDVGYNSAWGLIVNARYNDLLAEVPQIKAESEAPC
jgi:predicted transcriptional regulator of viral defense system